MTIHIRLALLAVIVFTPRAPAQESESPKNTFPMQPVLSARETTDQFCGRCVADSDMAYELMTSREKNAPRPGEPAPDFELYTANGDEKVRLSELSKTKPVVLFFSSWGCDIFRESLGGLQELYQRYSDEAHFVMVYIREVHSKDGWGSNLGRVNDAKDLEERMQHARRCREQLRLPYLILVDEMNDSVVTQWAGWPVRNFVVDTNGQIIYASAQGPWGYRPYRGFLHGSGKREGLDLEFNSQSLEELLEKRFPVKTSAAQP